MSVTCVHVPLLHEKEQLPVDPTAHVPASVLPLFVVVRTQLLIVWLARSPSQVMTTLVTFALVTMPPPAVTTQFCEGDAGCVRTVTA